MRELFGIASFVIGLGVVVPYVLEIRAGKAKPARSTRILFFFLMWTTLIVQLREFTSWTLAFTVAEVIAQIVLLSLAYKYGVGGFGKIDKLAYVLFAVAIIGYVASGGETLVGLVLLCITDLVSFVPTIVKNFKDPHSDSPIFFSVGAFAAALAVFAADDLGNMAEILFPAYLAIVNFLAFVPLIGRGERPEEIAA